MAEYDDEELKPIFCRTGSKTSIVDKILRIIPNHNTYVEAFAGGAAVFWKKPKANKNVINDKIYRVVRNDYNLTYIDKLNEKDYERIQKFKKHIEIKPWKKEGKYILVLPPSDMAKQYHYAPTWEEDTLNQLKQYTKRDIVVRKKDLKNLGSIEEQLKEAYACVTFNSTACIEAVLNGVPSFCDGASCGQPVSQLDLSQIENPIYSDDREKWLDSLLANQFTLSEISNGVAYEKLTRRL